MNNNTKKALIIGAIVVIVAAVAVLIMAVNNSISNSLSVETSSDADEDYDADYADYYDETDDSDDYADYTDEDYTEYKLDEQIIGQWKYYDSKSIDPNAEYIYTFNDDNTGQYKIDGTEIEFDYYTSDNKISIMYETGTFESEYKIDGDVLNIIDSAGNDTLYKKVK